MASKTVIRPIILKQLFASGSVNIGEYLLSLRPVIVKYDRDKVDPILKIILKLFIMNLKY